MLMDRPITGSTGLSKGQPRLAATLSQGDRRRLNCTDDTVMDSSHIVLRLGRPCDAQTIALLSRELIEPGLGWSWTPTRVLGSIHQPDTITLVAAAQQQLIGFAIMYFGQEQAHLDLLAVRPSHQRRGLGRRLLGWLEKSARTAGIVAIFLELRTANIGAHCFYQRLGFSDSAFLPGYYGGREAAIRMVRKLRVVR
jgi:ribosomal-protein-alanine N-acetyltransferase